MPCDLLLLRGSAPSIDRCSLCIPVCAYGAMELDEEKAVARVNAALWKGCGACEVACRCGAISVKGYTDSQIISLVKAVQEG